MKTAKSSIYTVQKLNNEQNISDIYLINISTNSSRKTRHEYIQINNSNAFTNVTFTAIQIPERENYTYSEIKNQIVNGNNNIYLTEKTITINNMDTNKKILLDIETVEYINEKAIVIVYLQGDNTQISQVNGEIMCLYEEILPEEVDALMKIDNDPKLSVNLFSGNLVYNDKIYETKTDTVTFPYLLSSRSDIYSLYSSNYYSQSLPFAFTTSLEYYLDFESSSSSFFSDTYYIVDPTGKHQAFNSVKKEDDKIIDELNEKEREIENNLCDFILRSNSFLTSDNITVRADIDLLYSEKSQSYMKKLVVEYDIVVDNVSQHEEESYIIINDSNNTSYFFFVYEYEGMSISNNRLHLMEIVDANGNSIKFNNEEYMNGETSNSYKTMEIPELDIEFEYKVENDLNPSFYSMYTKEVDFKKDQKRINYIWDFSNNTLTYQFYDYETTDTLLKEVTFTVDNENYGQINLIENKVSEERVEISYNNESKVSNVKKYMKDMELPYVNISFEYTPDYSKVIDELSNEEVTYIFDRNGNIKEIINESRRISNTYKDNKLKSQSSNIVLNLDEINNNQFKNKLENWSWTKAKEVYEENLSKGCQVHLTSGSTLSQTLSLLPGNTYKIKGRIKHENQNANIRIAIEGEYYLSGSQVGGIGGPSLDATLERYDISHIFNTSSSTVTDKTTWYEFSSTNLIILSKAKDISSKLTIYATDDMDIDYIEVVRVSTNTNILSNSYFENELSSWTYRNGTPVCTENIYKQEILVETGGSLYQFPSLIAGNSYIYRGVVRTKDEVESPTSLSRIEVSYYTKDEETGIINSELITNTKEVILSQIKNEWSYFSCPILNIPKNAAEITCKVIINANEDLYIKELNISLDNIDNINNYNLITNSRFEFGTNSITTSTSDINNKYNVSSTTDFEVIETDESIDKPRRYEKNVLKIKGNRLSSKTTKTLRRRINKKGLTNDTYKLTFLLKNNSVLESSLKAKLIFYNDDTQREIERICDEHGKFYQIVTKTYSSDIDYNYLDIIFEYNGINDIYITDLGLYENDKTEVQDYDDMGRIVCNKDVHYCYDNHGEIRNVLTKDGLIDYEYYELNKRMKKQKDLYDNIKEYLYDDTGRVTQETIKYPLEETLTNSAQYLDNKILFTDEFNKTSYEEYDNLKRVITSCDREGKKLTYDYNDKDQIYTLNAHNTSGIYASNIAKYNLDGTINYVKHNNKYKYEYSNSSLLNSIKLEKYNETTNPEETLEQYTYDDKLNLLSKQTLYGTYTYTYDSKNRIIKISYKKSNEETYTTLYKVTYNNWGQVMYYEDLESDELIYYVYDILGRVKTKYIIKNSLVVIKYTYNYDLEGKINSIENEYGASKKETKFVTSSEENLNTKERYLLNCINKYHTDIVLGNNVNKSIYGMTNTTDVTYTYDSSLKMNIANLLDNQNDLSYQFSEWNKYKQKTVINDQTYTVNSLKEQFDHNKTISLWFKPTSLAQETMFIKFENNQTNISVHISSDRTVKVKVGEESVVQTTNRVNINEWNFLSISMMEHQEENTTTIIIYLNEEMCDVTRTMPFSTENLTELILTETRESQRAMPFKLALLMIDGYNHNYETLTDIYEKGISSFIIPTVNDYTKTEYNIDGQMYEEIKNIDKQGRLISKQLKQEGTVKHTNTYEYNKTRIVKETSNNQIITYTYNENGLITKKDIETPSTQNEASHHDIHEYEYDLLNRLKQEKHNNITYDFTYDTNGNILTKKKTTTNTLEDSNTIDTVVENTSYVYDSKIKDKLVQYKVGTNRKYITYSNETSLYPTQIAGEELEWEKGRLISYKNNTYEYNAKGYRIKKTVGTRIHTYTLDEAKIIKEQITDNTNSINIIFEYIYDENNNLTGLIYNNNVYYYDRDITGEIRGIVDSNQSYVVKYTYTAFGEVEAPALTTTNPLTYNSFVYKGYYYDVETQLFYCNSRYYSPELCRFISPDSIEYLDPESINGLNLYCYCGNDPINRCDPSGHAWYNVLWDWVNTIAGFLNPTSTLTALGSIAVAAVDGRWSEVVEDWNNGCLNPFNQDASIAKKAKVLSFFKGSTVVRQDIIGYCSAFGTIWLNTGNDETDIMHEYGHSIQERILGPAYWPRIAIPSVIYNKFGSHENIDYYSTPWERTADWLGGVKGNRGAGYKKGSLAWAIAENLLGPIVIPFYFWFGY